MRRRGGRGGPILLSLSRGRRPIRISCLFQQDSTHRFGRRAELYSRHGLAAAAKHLNAGGVLALWSYEGNQPLEDAMRDVYQSVEIIPVKYFNQHVEESFTDWLFLGKLAS